MLHTMSWEEWERRQREKYSFQGKMLPAAAIKQLSLYGFAEHKTCGACRQYCPIQTTRKVKGKDVVVTTNHCGDSPDGSRWNGNWPACGHFEEKPIVIAPSE